MQPDAAQAVNMHVPFQVSLADLDRCVLVWLATADAHGQPNVSPKEVFARMGNEHVVIANIASPGSVRNIRQNPQVCLSGIDIFVQTGIKVVGVADVILPSDAGFDHWSRPLLDRTQGRFPIHSVIRIRVTAIDLIMAPSYRLYPETTEAAQVKAAMRTYGVVSAVVANAATD